MTDEGSVVEIEGNGVPGGCTMSRTRRWLILILVVLLLLGTLTMAALQYLRSPRAAADVAARLQLAYGGPVEVGEIDVGMQRSTVRQVKLFEPDSQAAETPWALIDEAVADVSLIDLLRGESTARNLTLTRAHIILRFDKDGHLLTRLPSQGDKPAALPEIRLHESQVTIRQEGRIDLEVTGVEATIRPQPEALVLEGDATDPTWGPWTVTGRLERASRKSSITLTTSRIHLTQPILETLPFVSPAVWHEVQLDGDTAVDLTVAYE